MTALIPSFTIFSLLFLSMVLLTHSDSTISMSTTSSSTTDNSGNSFVTDSSSQPKTNTIFPSEFHCVYYYEKDSKMIAGPMWFSKSMNKIRFDRKISISNLLSYIYHFDTNTGFLVNRTSSTDFKCQTWILNYKMPEVYNLEDSTYVGNETIRGEPCLHYRGTNNNYDVWISERNGMPWQGSTTYRSENYLYFEDGKQDPSTFVVPVDFKNCTLIGPLYDDPIEKLFRT